MVASPQAELFSFYEDFWSGDGPFPLIFAAPHLAKGQNYIEHDLVSQHACVDVLLAESLLEADRNRGFLGDGIPSIRADLGTTLLPSSLNLRIEVQANLHPWLCDHLSAEEYAKASLETWELSGEIPLATSFYRGLRGTDEHLPQPYLPDTQGIFDLSHLVIGTDLFLDLVDRGELIHRVQSKSLELFLKATRYFKNLLGESPGSMLHGHGMPGGVWFPDTGARISEDSCTLISDEMIDEYCLPYIRKAAEPFSRLFMHFCGRHEGFLHTICELEEVSTVNLGNPEMYDLEELLRLCGRSGTVYFGHLPQEADDDAGAHLERIAAQAKRYDARVILVLPEAPESAAERTALLKLWHNQTRPN